MYKVGDTIEMIYMKYDTDPILPGSKGKIESIATLGKETLLGVKWNDGKHFNVILPGDIIKKIDNDKTYGIFN